jgi:UDP-N-acetyl-D-mannosaminuronate dehydrogenase
MNAKTVTIVGQGYVGLPLAQAAARAGWTVHGLDVTESLVEALNSGTSHVDDLSDADIQEMLELGYRATTAR